MSEPKTIYLQWHGDQNPYPQADISVSDVTWCKDKVFAFDVEYARVPNSAFIAKTMRWLASREGKCSATTASILHRHIGEWLEKANHEAYLKGDEK